MHHCFFKNYGNLAKRLDFAYWWSYIITGLHSAINGATPSSLDNKAFIVRRVTIPWVSI